MKAYRERIMALLIAGLLATNTMSSLAAFDVTPESIVSTAVATVDASKEGDLNSHENICLISFSYDAPREEGAVGLGGWATVKIEKTLKGVPPIGIYRMRIQWNSNGIAPIENSKYIAAIKRSPENYESTYGAYFVSSLIARETNGIFVGSGNYSFGTLGEVEKLIDSGTSDSTEATVEEYTPNCYLVKTAKAAKIYSRATKKEMLRVDKNAVLIMIDKPFVENGVGYAEIMLDGTDGIIETSALMRTKEGAISGVKLPQDSTIANVKKSAYLYSSSGSNKSSVAIARKGTCLVVTKKAGSYYCIMYGNTKAYIHKNNLDIA